MTPSTSPIAPAPSTEKKSALSDTEKAGGFSQLRLPLYREVGRDGLFLKNTAVADELRRSVTKRLPTGAPERIAERLGKRVGQVYDEHAGEAKYSVDAFVAGLLELRPEEARYCLNKMARLVGAWCIPSAESDDFAAASL